MATDLSTHRDPTADLVRIGTLHAAIVFVPVVVVALLLLPPVLAVVVAAAIAVLVTVVRSRGIDDRVARTLGARPVGEDEAPRFVGLVEHGSMAVGVVPPRTFVIDDPALNAVAWGSGTDASSLAATTGLLDAADRIELEAVVAHLLVNVRDGVVEGPTVASALFGAISRGPLTGPVASIARAAADDRRVVQADLDGVLATQYPPGAVAALERLRRSSTTVQRSPRPLQPLWLAAPVEPDPSDPFAVHPPLADRIDLLREL